MYLIKEVHIKTLVNEEILLINLINGAADIIERNIYSNLESGDFDKIDNEILEKLIERKYLFNSKEEYDAFVEDLNNTIEKFEAQAYPNFLIVPTYDCNLNCIYCYEQSYEIHSNKNQNDRKLIVDKQFGFINDICSKISKTYTGGFDNRNVLITLMGGEPLLKNNRDTIRYIFQKIKENNYSFNIVTNGVDLDYYIEDLIKFQPNYIQITLDGTKEIHDKRRCFHNKGGSFDIIIENIGKSLDNKIKTYVRTNVDDKNLKCLPELAEVLHNRFNDNEYLHPYLYLLQDGGCSGDKSILSEEVGIQEIYSLEKSFPSMKIFTKKFHPSSFIDSIFSNSKFQPSLSHCSASNNQYILDYKGNVYKCWHGIGNDDYSIGNILSGEGINQITLDLWRKRSVSKMDKCITCNYRYICGTGCPAVQHVDYKNFDVSKPYCVEYKGLIDVITSEYL